MARTAVDEARLLKEGETDGPPTAGMASAPAPGTRERPGFGVATGPGIADAARAGIYGAFWMLIGSLLSGPVGLMVVAAVHPSPAWQGAKALADHYHPIQTLPFFCGFALVVGCDLMIAATYQLAAPREKARALLAVICAAAFTGLIGFNYVCQTTFVPALLQDYRPEYDAVVATLSLANPRSLGWAIEMWGWAFLGLATWLVAPVFGGSALERATAGALTLNGVLGVAGALITAADLGWVMTPPGFASYVAWNAVLMILAVLVIVSLTRRASQVRAWV